MRVETTPIKLQSLDYFNTIYSQTRKLQPITCKLCDLVNHYIYCIGDQGEDNLLLQTTPVLLFIYLFNNAMFGY